MNYFFDTEFIEDGKTIDLISIGIVTEDGREYYCANEECDLMKANDWVRKNVIGSIGVTQWQDRSLIAFDIMQLVGKDSDPKFWSYFADYDWVAFCQLFGTMMDLPVGFPMYCRDLKQLIDSCGDPPLPPQSGIPHNAIEDARWVKQAYNSLLGHVQ